MLFRPSWPVFRRISSSRPSFFGSPTAGWRTGAPRRNSRSRSVQMALRGPAHPGIPERPATTRSAPAGWPSRCAAHAPPSRALTQGLAARGARLSCCAGAIVRQTATVVRARGIGVRLGNTATRLGSRAWRVSWVRVKRRRLPRDRGLGSSRRGRVEIPRSAAVEADSTRAATRPEIPRSGPVEAASRRRRFEMPECPVRKYGAVFFRY